ncbi:MAG: hypothetical protein K0M50_01585 [Prolixibacteraceae bacterium]|nr:hypothetical protein [Prolixibacteraceae bacterium]
MSTQLIKLSRIAGWIVILLGAIHSANTFFVIRDVAIFDAMWRGTILFMYVAAGLGCLLAGGGMLLSTADAIHKTIIAHHIYLISAIFMLLLGIGAPIAMSFNPFGYISLAVGVFAVAVAILRYRHSVISVPKYAIDQ